MAVKKKKGLAPKAKPSPPETLSKPRNSGPKSAWGKEMISTYGEDHPWVRVNVFGEHGLWKATHKEEAPKKKKKINGAKKGKAFEREWANEIGHIFPEAKRHLEYQADEASAGVDLEGTDIFKFQLKNHQNYVSVGTIYEIKKLENGEVPVLITKGNKLPTMAVLPATAFIHLLEVYYGLEPQKTTHVKTVQRIEAKKELRLLLSDADKMDESPRTSRDIPKEVSCGHIDCQIGGISCGNIKSLPCTGPLSASAQLTIHDLI